MNKGNISNFRSNIWYNVKSFCKKIHLFYILLVAALYFGKLAMYKMSNRINPNGHILNMRIDELIPFIKYFAIFYLTYYIYPQLLLYILSYTNKNKFYILLISAWIACIISNIVFITYNVKMVRPEVTGNGIFDQMVIWIYNHDGKALNCFPSIHAIMGVFMILGVYKETNLPKWFKVITTISGIGCAISTVFVKQHYFVDLVAGVLLYLVVYYLTQLIYYKKISKGDSNDPKYGE